MLVKVQAFDKRLNHRYEWRSAKQGLFGLFKRQEGFYHVFSISEDFAFTLEYANKHFIVEDNQTYDKPYVKMIFANPSCDLIEEYETLTEAEARCQEVRMLASNSIWLTS